MEHGELLKRQTVSYWKDVRKDKTFNPRNSIQKQLSLNQNIRRETLATMKT